jgi:polyphosphate kinase 2 (PPK2 family)
MAASSALAGEAAYARLAIEATNATTPTTSHATFLQRFIRFLPLSFEMQSLDRSDYGCVWERRSDRSHSRLMFKFKRPAALQLG